MSKRSKVYTVVILLKWYVPTYYSSSLERHADMVAPGSWPFVELSSYIHPHHAASVIAAHLASLALHKPTSISAPSAYLARFKYGDRHRDSVEGGSYVQNQNGRRVRRRCPIGGRGGGRSAGPQGVMSACFRFRTLFPFVRHLCSCHSNLMQSRYPEVIFVILYQPLINHDDEMDLLMPPHRCTDIAEIRFTESTNFTGPITRHVERWHIHRRPFISPRHRHDPFTRPPKH